MAEVQAGAAIAEAPVVPPAEVKEGETPKVEEKKETAPPRVYSQEEVDRIAAKIKKNERYRTKKEVEAFYQGRDSVAKPEAQKKEEEAKEPTREQFDTYESFIEARADFRARKATREESGRIEKEKTEFTAQEARQKKHVAFQTKMREKFPDIEERVAEVGDVPMYRGVQEAIAESELGPEIFDELLRNPKEFDRLSAMSEAAAIREIGKLEARLEAKAPKADVTKETKPASKAPPPISPPSGEPASSSDLPSDKDDINTWMKKERARLAKQKK